jgi:cell division septation protein DedD
LPLPSPAVPETWKKSWKSKLIILLFLLVLGYLAWVILMPHKPEPWSPSPSQSYPAKTGNQEKTQGNTKPNLPVRYRLEPGFSKTGLPKADVSGNDLSLVSFPSQDLQPQDKKPQPESENRVKAESSAILGSGESPSQAGRQPPLTITLEPALVLVPKAMEDLPPPFSETEFQGLPSESPLEKKPLIVQGENDSDELAMPPASEITPENEAVIHPPDTSASTGFSLRLGAFLKKKNAEDLISNLEKKGYKPYIFETTDTKKRTWYAVHLSDHEDREAAEAATVVFRNKEKATIVITHKNSLKQVAGGLKK